MKDFSPKSRFGKRDTHRSDDRDTSRFRDSGRFRDAAKSRERNSFRDSDRPSERHSNRSSDRDSDRPRDSGRFGGRRESRDFGSEKRMHRVTCDKCGAKCEVPFRPTEGKPVYCSDCFRKEESSSKKQDSMSKGEFEMLNKKLDKILKALNID